MLDMGSVAFIVCLAILINYNIGLQRSKQTETWGNSFRRCAFLLQVLEQFDHLFLVAWLFLHNLYQFTYYFILLLVLLACLFFLILIFCKKVFIIFLGFSQRLLQQTFIHKLVQQIRCSLLEFLRSLQIFKHFLKSFAYLLPCLIIIIEARQQLLESFPEITHSNVTIFRTLIVLSLHFFHKLLIFILYFFHYFQVFILFLPFFFLLICQIQISLFKLVYQLIDVFIQILFLLLLFRLLWMLGFDRLCLGRSRLFYFDGFCLWLFGDL